MNPNVEYRSLDSAFDFFNAHLFDATLPKVLITLRNLARSRGYFRSEAFSSRLQQDVVTDEISLCMNTFSRRTDKEILSTLVHEMVHLWQSYFGKPGRRAYHNLEWADKMISVGLFPSDTGRQGGKMTGQRVSHYILANGNFDLAAQELLANGWHLNWEEHSPQVAVALPGNNGVATLSSKRQTRKKFACGKCGMAAWARFSANLVCGSCNNTMT